MANRRRDQVKRDTEARYGHSRASARRLALAVAALIVAFGVAIAFVLTQPWIRNPPSSEVGLSIGQFAPDFIVTDVNGTAWSLSAHRGQVVLIDFMGSNCSTCIREMKDGILQGIYAAHASRGLAILSVDVGGPLGTEHELEAWRFLKGQTSYGTWEPGEWTIALDNQGLAGTYRVTGLPVKYLLDPAGRIVMKWPGLVSFSDLNAAIESAVG